MLLPPAPLPSLHCKLLSRNCGTNGSGFPALHTVGNLTRSIGRTQEYLIRLLVPPRGLPDVRILLPFEELRPVSNCF